MNHGSHSSDWGDADNVCVLMILHPGITSGFCNHCISIIYVVEPSVVTYSDLLICCEMTEPH